MICAGVVQSGGMTDPAAIAPDDKDWTWVLDRTCPECQFDVRSFPLETVGQLINSNAEAWRAPLASDTAAVRSDPGRWSTLEYGCHVRDVYRLYLERLNLMLDQDGPKYPNWDQDETAIADDYPSQDPPTVADQLVVAASELADRFDTVTGIGWERTGYRSDGAAFTVATFARYLIHDPVHHLWDVTRG